MHFKNPQNWFHVKSKWCKNLEVSTLCVCKYENGTGCSIWNTSKAVLYHWDNAFLTLCCKSQNVFDFWTMQIYGFYCTSSSYQLHCPPCNIMPPGVVNWNPRKESRHSRNFFFRGYNYYFANIEFWNQQSIQLTWIWDMQRHWSGHCPRIDWTKEIITYVNGRSHILCFD